MKWKIISVVQCGPPAGVNFDLQLCADIFDFFLHIQFFGSYLETQSQEIKVTISTQCEATVIPKFNRKKSFIYLFVEHHSADRAQLLDEGGHDLLRLTPPHYEVTVTQVKKQTHGQKSHYSRKSASWVKDYWWRKSPELYVQHFKLCK